MRRVGAAGSGRCSARPRPARARRRSARRAARRRRCARAAAAAAGSGVTSVRCGRCAGCSSLAGAAWAAVRRAIVRAAAPIRGASPGAGPTIRRSGRSPRGSPERTEARATLEPPRLGVGVAMLAGDVAAVRANSWRTRLRAAGAIEGSLVVGLAASGQGRPYSRSAAPARVRTRVPATVSARGLVRSRRSGRWWSRPASRGGARARGAGGG